MLCLFGLRKASPGHIGTGRERQVLQIRVCLTGKKGSSGQWCPMELASCWPQDRFYLKVSDSIPLNTGQSKCGFM